MNKRPGAYLLTRCNLVNCPFNKLRICAFLGLGRYDIAYIKKLTICGGCGGTFENIEDIEFSKCKWSFRGMTVSNQEISSPEIDSDSEMNRFPIKQQRWKWLIIEAGEVNTDPGNSVASIGVQVKHEDVGPDTIDKLTAEKNKYKAKYKELKTKLKADKLLSYINLSS